MYQSFFKRTIDIVCAILLLIFLSPLILFIACLIPFFLGFPVLFCQNRSGIHETPFKLIKFKTMPNLKNNDNTLADDDRLTAFGRLLRSLSLDELPGLINVIKGEMSLVGPRPLLEEYSPHYSDFQRQRFKVKPGITGWAQINGRNSISWEDKFKHDVWYVENISFFVDVKILFLTIYQVFKRKGIHAEGYSTMPKFRGANSEK